MTQIKKKKNLNNLEQSTKKYIFKPKNNLSNRKIYI